MSEAWTRQEVEATVTDYFHMLILDLAGQQYGKTDHRRKLHIEGFVGANGAVSGVH